MTWRTQGVARNIRFDVPRSGRQDWINKLGTFVEAKQEETRFRSRGLGQRKENMSTNSTTSEPKNQPGEQEKNDYKLGNK